MPSDFNLFQPAFLIVKNPPATACQCLWISKLLFSMNYNSSDYLLWFQLFRMRPGIFTVFYLLSFFSCQWNLWWLKVLFFAPGLSNFLSIVYSRRKAWTLNCPPPHPSFLLYKYSVDPNLDQFLPLGLATFWSITLVTVYCHPLISHHLLHQEHLNYIFISWSN